MTQETAQTQPQTATPESQPESQFVTTDQLAATVRSLAALVRETRQTQAETAQPASQPVNTPASQPQPQQPNPELTALQNRLERFEAQESDRRRREGLTSLVKAESLDPMAVDVLLAQLGDKLRLGETGLYLADGSPVEDFIKQFKATPVGQRFLSLPEAPKAQPKGPKTQPETKTSAADLLMQAFGRA